jgi:hypothetical protein
MSIFLQLKFHGYGLSRLMSDMSRLEAKVERLTDQLGSKERELQALTRAKGSSCSQGTAGEAAT